MPETRSFKRPQSPKTLAPTNPRRSEDLELVPLQVHDAGLGWREM